MGKLSHKGKAQAQAPAGIRAEAQNLSPVPRAVCERVAGPAHLPEVQVIG